MLSHLHQIFVAFFTALAGYGMYRAARPAAPAAPAAAPDSPQPVTAPSRPPRVSDGLTARGCMELVGHEAIVCEAYRDSKGIWTWGIGITNASGHNVDRYKDNPQSIEGVLAVFIWLLRAMYLPVVLRAFRGFTLTESQLAAALSFHYNTGAIGHASWVALWKEGNVAAARASFMEWVHPPSITERRQEECDLFFGGKWSSNGFALVLPVLKPPYQPDFRHGKKVDVLPLLEAILA